ncbi:MAG: BON domain-containing protein [bacterium]|nr:BON domain-containing protein [bacterium]
MAETPVRAERPDMDIQEEIHDHLTDYPPLSHDRHRVHVEVQNGAVTVSGHVKTPQTLRYLINKIEQVEGVKSVTNEGLYDDETLRLEVGRLVPVGVFVNTEYGAVILSGNLAAGAAVESLVQQVAQVPGVHRVLTTFK